MTSAQQLTLHGLPVAPAPVVRPLAVYRRAKRLLREWATRGASLGFELFAYVDALATRDELRAQLRAALRNEKRMAREQGTHLRGGRAAARFAASPEGRRYHRAISEVSERLQAWENALCG